VRPDDDHRSVSRGSKPHGSGERLCANDLVEFVGPQRPVRLWPEAGERGAVERMGTDGVRVVWERSALVVSWPIDWVKPITPD
jgi:hypothetical protein